MCTPQAPRRMALVAVLSAGQRCVMAFRRHRVAVERAQTLMCIVVIPLILIQCVSYCLPLNFPVCITQLCEAEQCGVAHCNTEGVILHIPFNFLVILVHVAFSWLIPLL